MKKTLMTVLCFALGASFATAQTNTVERVKANQQQQMAVSAANMVTNSGYKGSIFTKDAGDSIFATSFAAEESALFSTGIIGANAMVDTIAIPQHQQTYYASQWHRLNDTTMATYTANAQYYSALYQTFANFEPITSESPEDGFMVMSMQDQISQWGGAGNGFVGNFDAYIQFQTFATTGHPVIDVSLWQYYRAFNSDECNMDYSLDGGNTWAGTVEFNVQGIDVAVNSSIRRRDMITMPAECGNAAGVTLRLRWSCSSNNGGAYGYFWFVDDFEVVAGEESRLRIVDYSNYDGFYHIMPEGLQVPLVSYVTFENNGLNTQTNIMSKIFTYEEGATATKLAESVAMNDVAFNSGKQQLLIDPLGFLGGSGIDYGVGNEYWAPEVETNRTGTQGSLPTDIEGMGFYYSQLSSAALTYNLDTFGYEVSRAGDIASMEVNKLWGRDNGVLRKFSRFTEGKTSDGYLTDEPADNGVGMANYQVRMAYTTGDVVPEGWVIRGIQMVASTLPGYNTVGTQIYPILAYDSAGTPDGTGSYSIYFNALETGAGVHTVTESEVMTGDALENLTYNTRGSYNVINLQFPNQPELKAKTSYRIGYQLVTPSTFAVAAATNGYLDLDTNSVMFDTVPGMEGYRNTQTLPTYKILVYDPNYATSPWTWVGSNAATNIPMIRMIVGPKVFIPSHAITVECGDEFTEILDGEYNNVCGMTDSLVQGSTNTFYAQAIDPMYEIDKVYLDGQELTDGDGVLTMDVDDEGNAYAIVELINVQAEHTLKATTKNIGIDPVAAGVKMNLQPNPATNNVQLTISGVEGMVTYSLLDMSGRVISSARINAESINNIDLSKLAKGAYFVRITSDKFSKVEKLIVR